MNPVPTRPNADNRVLLGDRGWVGVDMRLDPALLPPGYCSLAVNLRFEAGLPQTRKGRAIVPWLNKITAGNVGPFGVIHGRGNFRDPVTRLRYTLFAADGGIYRALANNAPTAMTLPAGVTLSGTVRFTQAFNRVFCHRGFDLPTLEFTGETGEWRFIEDAPAGTGLTVMQNVERSLFVSDRLFTLQQDDEVGASDIGEPRYYVPLVQEMAVKQGSADDLVALAKHGKNTIIALKDQSLHAIYGVYGNLGSLQQNELTDEFGCVAPDAVTRVGNELWILSQIGLVAIEEHAANENQSFLRIKTRTNEAGEQVPVRISAPLQPLFDRINWQYVHLARSAHVGTKYYLALPIDRAEVLGPEIAATGATQNSTSFARKVVAGKTYRYTQGANDVGGSLTNGTETLTTSGDFVAQGTSVTIARAPGPAGPAVITASLRHLEKGVLNVIAVYDQENSAWSGYDEADGFAVRDLWVDNYLGRERLFVTDHDGFNLLYEETSEDHLPVPYVDVVVNTLPAVGNTIQVNGGTTVTATALSQNGGSGWGCSTLALARADLFADQNGNGYGNNSAWTAPDTQGVEIANGVRFYSTTGMLPSIVTSGSWASFTYGKTAPIRTTFRSRGYTLPASSRVRGHRLTVNWQTWSPKLSVNLLRPGVNETTALLTDQTRDRTHYTRPAHTADYVLDNTNGDHDTPYREDYSVKFGPGGAAAGETESIDLDASGGVAFNLKQESRYNRRLAGLRDRAVQVEILNTLGTFQLQTLALETADERGADGFAN